MLEEKTRRKAQRNNNFIPWVSKIT